MDHALIGEGSQLIDADVRRCVIVRNVRIEAGAQVEDSVIFDHTRIGAKARLHRVVIDRQNEIPAGVELGYTGYTEGAENSAVQWMRSGLAVLPKPVVGEDPAKRRFSSY